MVHLVRPAEFKAGDKVYMQQIVTVHPDLADFIYAHVYDEADQSEHIIMDVVVFELPKVLEVMIKDAKFDILEYVTKQGKKVDLDNHITELMAKVTANAEVID